MTFSCGQLPANVSCTFAPPSLTIAAGTTTATDTLTINTAATTSAALLKAAASTGAGIFTAGTLWLPASLLALLGMRRRSSRLPRLLEVSLLALSAGVITLTGCGSPTPTGSAKPGTYSIPVNLSISGGSSQTVNATVIVQ